MIHKRPSFLIFLCIVFFFLLSASSERVKEPAVAGSFYPADKEVLARKVDGFISAAEVKPVNGKMIALIAPHAGYVFSGAVAGHTYGHLKDKDINTVILIGPSHHSAFQGASVYEQGKMRTPLGTVEIDHEIAGRLINKDADVTFYPDAFEKEHSLEVQLPFLQRSLKDFRIVPILIGSPTKASYDYLTAKLTEIIKGDEKIMIVASTDFSHYHDYDTAVKMDTKTIGAIESMSIPDVERYLRTKEGEMCGGYPVLYTMAVAKSLGATNGILHKYSNSGDVTGHRSRVVGYAAIGIYRSPLDVSEKDALLGIAKDTINSYVKDRTIPDVQIPGKRLKALGATFVTIKNPHGLLRGCIGEITPTQPLYRSVINNAVRASSHDSRFPPMKKEELTGISVEVSVLSPFETINNINEIEVGRDGLYLVKDNRSGLLLPQVPLEFGWDRDKFLKQVSKKAGLPEDAWREGTLYRFTADIIK